MPRPKKSQPSQTPPPAFDGDPDQADDRDLDLPPGPASGDGGGLASPAGFRPAETEIPPDAEELPGGDDDLGGAEEDYPEEGSGEPAGVGMEPGESPPPMPAPRRVRRGPDTSPSMPDRKEPERALPGFDGTPNFPGRDTFSDVSQLAEALTQIAGKAWVKIKRLEPRDLPSGEYGESQMIEVRATNPTPADVLQLVRDKFGGGGYEVWLYGNEDEREGRPIIKRIQLSGDWKPISLEGHLAALKQFQIHKALSTGVSMDQSAGDKNTAVELFTKIQELSAAERAQIRSLEEEARRRGDTANAELLRHMLSREAAPRPSLFSAESIAAIGAVLTPVVGGIVALLKESRERSERQMQAILDKMGEKKDPSATSEIMLEGVRSVLRVQEEQSKQMLALHTKAAEQVLKRAGGDEAAGGFREAILGAIAERGPDLMVRLMDMGKFLMQMKAQQQGAQAVGQAAPPPPLPASAPPSGPPAPVPSPSPGEQPPSAPPADAGQPSGVPPGAQGLDPREEGRRLAVQNMAVFCYLLTRMAVPKHDVQEVWEHEHDDLGRKDLLNFWAGAPAEFRSRVITAAEGAHKASSSDLLRDVPSWFEGFLEEAPTFKESALLSQQAAILIDTLKQDRSAVEWLNQVLQDAPWLRNEEDGEDD